MATTKRRPTYQPLYDGISATAEASASAPATKRATKRPAAAPDQPAPRIVTAQREPDAGMGRQRGARPTFGQVVVASPVATASPVPLLYVAEDMRSFVVTGRPDAYPAILPAAWSSLAFGDTSAVAVPLHRLTPTLWARLQGQLATIWETVRRDAVRRNEFLDRIDPLLDYARASGWEVTL